MVNRLFQHLHPVLGVVHRLGIRIPLVEHYSHLSLGRARNAVSVRHGLLCCFYLSQQKPHVLPNELRLDWLVEVCADSFKLPCSLCFTHHHQSVSSGRASIRLTMSRTFVWAY